VAEDQQCGTCRDGTQLIDDVASECRQGYFNGWLACRSSLSLQVGQDEVQVPGS
jgi:hypothetical protein